MGRGREIEINPLTAHLVEWFLRLNDVRSFTAVAGMGGGALIPDAINHQEILAWSRLSGMQLSSWEVEALREMDRAWCAGYSAKKGGAAAPVGGAQYQALGEYCKGEKVAECRRIFGNQLEKICATCPD